LTEDSAAPRPVHFLPRSMLGETVVFASTGRKDGAKSYLSLILLRALAPFTSRRYAPSDESAFTLSKDVWGAPSLLIGKEQGPYISFSSAEDRLWAAMSDKAVGIDIAYPEEFAGSYPFARVFRPEEIACAGVLCRGDTARGAALLWSAKEASVKATGTGFNIFDPFDVQVGAPVLGEEGLFLEVFVDQPISVWARPEGQGWLSVALA